MHRRTHTHTHTHTIHQSNSFVQFICGNAQSNHIFLQTMFATSPYSDPVTSLDADPKPMVDEEEGLLWVVGPVLAVIFIVCIVIAILLFKR